VGRRPRETGPVVDGILVVDKPAGPTSHGVVQTVRRAAGQKRVGHTGTLDPAATGVLVVCMGRATKLVPFLQAGRKTYAARMRLGVETDSQDAEGAVVATHDASHVDERSLCEALTRFQGDIEQIPPMVSAIKIGGERLHEKARRGETVERAPRKVTVDDLMLDAFEPGMHAEASFLVTCSAGTYVRTIAHDVGQALGVGGSLVALRRIANGPFVVDEAHTVDHIVQVAEQGAFHSLLLDPLDAVARLLPTIEVDDPDLVRRLTQGGKLPEPATTGSVAATANIGPDASPRLLGIYRAVQAGVPARPELVWTRPEELA
jgi:tRNA pseudouridine55 synthase